MTVSVVFEEQVEIPYGLDSLTGFRGWAASEDFPQRGRIDYIAGRIEVDMWPEDLFSHGTLKTEIIGVVQQILKSARGGYLFTDSTRVSCPAADLSVEPDIVFISEASLQAGGVRFVPKATDEPDRYIEIEGAPDLIIEIVSDRSATKDTKRLPAAYYLAGVPEFWLIDARRECPMFRIHRRGPSAFEPVPPDAEGFQYSAVLDARLLLTRTRNEFGRLTFDLRQKPGAGGE